jgi:PAS domain S-box-containing protein
LRFASDTSLDTIGRSDARSWTEWRIHVNGDADEFPSSDAFNREALTLAESVGVGVWSIDLKAVRVRGTAQFFRIMGLPLTSDSIPVDALRALRHPDDDERVLLDFRQALEKGGDAREIEYRIIRPDTQVRWIFSRGRVIRDAAGVPIRHNGVALDITDRKALETTLHHAHRLGAVGQLTDGTAHDFNNVLQVIVGNLEIIRIGLNRIVANEELRTLLDRALARAERATQSAKDLIANSRPGAPPS